ncbi:sugar ABC transporter substrate-binding protein [Alkalihalobacillus sp. MEB130]|uniref:sugar ABC transporter substrate-binding protein n=1 Tax=Alkalihalobacillus sp. MEB130 TaxID=2976704 RepID=UPI0028DD96B6|nr:sugar ABC transporter substrate-binding protein [Alkalihalobacillus sp. MEB130]MDT8860131.1 sugar ABC transporter substrate-binding protein [Alkalihalobacillus sp. MEB130]
MFKKKLVSLVSVVALAGMLSACGSEGSSSEPTGDLVEEGTENVAVVLKTLSSQYWKYVEAGAKQAGEDLGVNVTVLGPAAESQIMEQVNMIEDSLSQGPDALVLSPSQPSTVVPALSQATSDNIPVFFIDTDADYDEKQSFLGTDNYSAGYEGGQLLAEQLEAGDKVALIGGALGNTATDERVKGAKAALEEAGIEIAAEQPANSDRTEAMNVMENILQTQGDIKGVFAANDDMAIGAARAASSNGLSIPIIGTDGTVEAVEAIINGELFGSIAQSPYDMGYQGVENAIKVLKGETVEKRIDTGVSIVTAENAEEVLEFLNSISGN